MQTNWTTLLFSLFGACKLILQPFGIEIPDQNINEIVNGVAAAVTIYGVIKSHIKKTKDRQHPFDGGVTSAQSSNTPGYNK